MISGRIVPNNLSRIRLEQRHVEAGNLGHSLAGDALQVAHHSDRRADKRQDLRLSL